MGRYRLYASHADRQRAYRNRLAEGHPAAEGPRPTKARRQPSRPARLRALLRALDDLRDEYQAWTDKMLENMQDGPQSERLAETVDQLDEAINLLNDINLPLGFGRD